MTVTAKVACVDCGELIKFEGVLSKSVAIKMISNKQCVACIAREELKKAALELKDRFSFSPEAIKQLEIV